VYLNLYENAITHFRDCLDSRPAEFLREFLPIKAILTTLAGGKRGKINEKWRKKNQKGGG